MTFKALAAMAFLALGAVTLASCGEEKKAVTTYDLSAASNQKYLADNALKPGVKRLPSGLQYRVIKAGTGKRVTSAGDMVTVTYKGQLINGKVFDQTQPGQTATFPAGRLIPGWVEALSLMKEGDEWELVIPSDLGYGAQGAGADIPANQTLIFNMTLISVAPSQ
jgi:FKBP-type peptidyl-prolyl cis-trans isomerase